MMAAMRRPLAAFVLVLGVLTPAGLVSPDAAAQTAPERFPPDIIVRALDGAATNPVEIDIDRSADGTKRLQFAFKAENAGTGPLELKPKREDCNHDGSTSDDRTA